MGSTSGPGTLARWMRRLTASNDQLLADERQLAAEKAGATPVQQCQDRALVSVSGTITALTVPPKDVVRVEADLDDGSGQVKLIWMGRREIRGITAGTALRATGRMSCCGTSRVIYNPAYEIINTPN
ncbi:OB-fold nucleic acid binding domain-containing protein [Naumannella halotolerans]|uniref:OB-fold nucleic acid binding domain-containing protein n=1 Tax=Naumannella halotolerans TaxID=993414 RepID=UPI00370DDC7F